jgi:hypothetical protein
MGVLALAAARLRVGRQGAIWLNIGRGGAPRGDRDYHDGLAVRNVKIERFAHCPLTFAKGIGAEDRFGF